VGHAIRNIARAAAIVIAVTVVLPRPVSGAEQLLTPEARKAAIKCQGELLKAGLTFVAKKLKLLDRCAVAAFACVQQQPDDLECLDKAAERCTKSLDKIVALETLLAERIIAGCSAMDPVDLLAAAGLGFDVVGSECASEYDSALSDTASVAACVVKQHECLAEQLFQTHEPRAEEMLELLGLDLGEDSCLEDREGEGEPIEDPELGRPLAKCQGALRKASTGFVARKLKQMAGCLRLLFGCAQNEPGDDECVDSATSKCDKAFASVEKEVLKLGAIVGKSCGTLPIAALTEPDGLGADVLLPVCVTLGVDGIGSAHDYGNCVVRQHECAVDDIVRFQAPRAAEMLAGAGRTLPGGFFCPSPTPTAMPTPSATPTGP
jgi:hypothetical protein